MKIIECNNLSPDATIAIVVSRFNEFINKNLLNSAIDVIKRIGQIKDNNITIVWVPGAYEIPLISNILAKSKKYNAILAIGTIIKGDTNHFDYISKECISGLSKISIKNLIPIIFGLLITDNIKQAIERSGIKNTNKGAESALTMLEMINLLNIIKSTNI
ncbi:MAG: 6,7-dimethyl-8-ribityllumazine synthase [Enterobacterales bacterium]